MTETSIALQIVVGLFLLLESANVLALYFTPGSEKMNAVGVFQDWEESKKDADLHAFVQYLVYWVAGTKLIFIALWWVILLTAGPKTQLIASAVMVPCIATFYWRLYPLARKLDRKGRMKPEKYSMVLGWMIGGFLVAFSAGTAITFFG